MSAEREPLFEQARRLIWHQRAQKITVNGLAAQLQALGLTDEETQYFVEQRAEVIAYYEQVGFEDDAPPPVETPALVREPAPVSVVETPSTPEASAPSPAPQPEAPIPLVSSTASNPALIMTAHQTAVRLASEGHSRPTVFRQLKELGLPPPQAADLVDQYVPGKPSAHTFYRTEVVLPVQTTPEPSVSTPPAQNREALLYQARRTAREMFLNRSNEATVLQKLATMGIPSREAQNIVNAYSAYAGSERGAEGDSSAVNWKLWSGVAMIVIGGFFFCGTTLTSSSSEVTFGAIGMILTGIFRIVRSTS